MKIIFTDIDDTLLRTDAKVYFNEDKTIDVHEFEEADRFRTALLNKTYIEFLRDEVSKGAILGYITARGSGASNTEHTTSVLNEVLKDTGIQIDPEYAYGVSDPKWEGILTARDAAGGLSSKVINARKVEVLRKYVDAGNEVYLYDDKRIESDLPAEVTVIVPKWWE